MLQLSKFYVKLILVTEELRLKLYKLLPETGRLFLCSKSRREPVEELDLSRPPSFSHEEWQAILKFNRDFQERNNALDEQLRKSK